MARAPDFVEVVDQRRVASAPEGRGDVTHRCGSNVRVAVTVTVTACPHVDEVAQTIAQARNACARFLWGRLRGDGRPPLPPRPAASATNHGSVGVLPPRPAGVPFCARCGLVARLSSRRSRSARLLALSSLTCSVRAGPLRQSPPPPLRGQLHDPPVSLPSLRGPRRPSACDLRPRFGARGALRTHEGAPRPLCASAQRRVRLSGASERSGSSRAEESLVAANARHAALPTSRPAHTASKSRACDSSRSGLAR